MDLTVEIAHRSAHVLRGGSTIATLKLDYIEQLGAVIFFPRATRPDRERILRLAGTHVVGYVKHRERPAMGGLMTATHGDPALTRADSRRLLTFDAPVPDRVASLSADELTRALKELSIPVIDAAYDTYDQALKAVVSDRRLGCKIRYTAALDLLDELVVTFTTHQANAFAFWHNVSMPFSGGGWDLYVVPDYHPVRQHGRTQVALVNGDTDAYIRGQAVRYIYSPESARIKDGFGTTWSYVKHPFYVADNSFSAKLIPMHLLSEGGVEEVVQMLLGALERDGKYIAIGGGFRPPAGTQSVVHRGKRLGSEQFCYWARQVLQEEGRLAGAHIPSWM